MFCRVVVNAESVLRKSPCRGMPKLMMLSTGKIALFQIIAAERVFAVLHHKVNPRKTFGKKAAVFLCAINCWIKSCSHLTIISHLLWHTGRAFGAAKGKRNCKTMGAAAEKARTPSTSSRGSGVTLPGEGTPARTGGGSMPLGPDADEDSVGGLLP